MSKHDNEQNIIYRYPLIWALVFGAVVLAGFIAALYQAAGHH